MTLFDGPDIGERVAHYRRLNGWTMDELVRRADGEIGKSVIANLETGRRQDVTVTQLMTLAYALGVPPAALLLPVDRPFDRVDLGGWNRSIDTIRRIFAGDALWTTHDEATPAGLRAVRLIAAAEQLETLLLQLTFELAGLRPTYQRDQLRALVRNPPRRRNPLAAADDADSAGALDAWLRTLHLYEDLRVRFEELGGSDGSGFSVDDWLIAQYGADNGTSADSAE